jgi:precorrin-6A/cobalt-precorrin-6A reductase
MILILGGTKDSRFIANKIIEDNLKVIITTTTDYGASLLPEHPHLIKKIGRYSQDDLENLIKEYSVTIIIDATHPYAENISRNIIEVSNKLDISLYRYERPRKRNHYGKYFDTYEEIVSNLKDIDGNILLTIGSKDLEFFSKALAMSRLIVRVLPMASVIKKCKTLGFSPNQIIAVQGPFSKAFNDVIIKDYNIKYLITKDTGAIGGFNEKINSAAEANIKVFIKSRPELPYTNIFDNLKTLDSIIKLLDE